MQFYVHSGRLGRSGVPWAVVWGLFAGLLLCRYYARAVCWLPVVVANPLITVAYGFAVGSATALGAKLGHLRNPPVVKFLGGLMGLAAVYFAWAYTPMTRIGLFDGPVWDFETLWDYVILQYAQGSWSLWPSGPAVAGVLLVAVWLAEAVVIVYLSAWTAHRWLIDRPYCEETEQWMKWERNMARLSLTDDTADAALERLNKGDLSVLAELPCATDNEPPYLQLDLASIDVCSFCKFLTVTLIESVANEKGRVHRRRTRLLDKLHIEEDELSLIREAGLAGAARARQGGGDTESAEHE